MCAPSTRWCWWPSQPSRGCVIPVEPIGVFQMTDEKGSDDKVLCVPYKDPKWSHMHDITDIRDSLLDESVTSSTCTRISSTAPPPWWTAGTAAHTPTR